MKTKLAFIAAITLLPLQAQSSDWRTSDTIRQGIVLVAFEIDRRQTQYASKRPDEFDEQGFGLGKDPSSKRVNTYFLVVSVLHTGISYYLPPDLREGWQYVTIGIEAGAIYNNYSIGIKIPF